MALNKMYKQYLGSFREYAPMRRIKYQTILK